MNKGAIGDYCEFDLVFNYRRKYKNGNTLVVLQAPQKIRPPRENMLAASWKGTLYFYVSPNSVLFS